MRTPRLAFVFLLVFASLASSQWLETTLLLPDSFSGLTQPVHLLWDSLDNTIYAGGAVGNNMLVIDDRTGIKKALIPTLFPVTQLASGPDCRKVYALNARRKTVLVFDASTHQWLDSFQKATEQNGPCYNPVGRKLYYTGGWDVTVVGCDADSVLSAVHVHAGFSYPCYVARHNSVYCSDWYNRGVWVIDGVTDTFVRFIYTDRHQPCNLEYDWRDDKIYTTSNLWNDSSISVVSCSLNMVIDTIKVFRMLGRLRYNPINNRLYVADGSSGGSRLAAIDCATDSILHFISVGSGPAFLVFDSLHNRIYCTNTASNSVSVVDCSGDSVIATIPVDSAPGFALLAATTHRLFCISNRASVLNVVDTDSNSIVARVPLTRCSPAALCYHPSNGRVYGACGNIDSVAVIAGDANTVTTLVPVGDRPTFICSNPLEDKIYCAGLDSSLAVIDGASDTVAATLWFGTQPSALCFSTSADKLYYAGSTNGTVYVVSGATDSLVATIAVGAQPAALCANTLDNKVYSASRAGGTVSVINGDSDSVVATVAIGAQPVALCFNSLSDKIYSANSGAASVSIIDGASDRLLGHAPAGGSPVALCYNPLANRVYCANSTSNNITVLDGAGDTLLAIVPVGSRPAALSFDSVHNYVYCLNPNGDSVTVIDAAFNTVVSVVPVGDNPVALAWAPTVNRMYVANRDGSSISVLNTTPPGAEESAAKRTKVKNPTVVRGSLVLRGSDRTMLLDVSGRLVMGLRPGINDISGLAPGVYFVLTASDNNPRKFLVLR